MVDAVAGIVVPQPPRDEPAEVVLDCGEPADQRGLAAATPIPGAPSQYVRLRCMIGAEGMAKEQGYVVEVASDGERRESLRLEIQPIRIPPRLIQDAWQSM